MKLTFHSHLGASHLLHSSGILEEIATVLRKLPTPVWPGKSEANADYEVVQQMVNSLIEHELLKKGWLSQPKVVASSSAYYADFWKQAKAPWAMRGLPEQNVRALCEIQFGNVGRLGMDNEKFRIGFQEDRADVGIQVVPMAALAKRVDRSVANFEKTKSLIEKLGRGSLQVPVLVIGLDAEPSKALDMRNWAKALTVLTGPGSQKRRQALAAKILG